MKKFNQMAEREMSKVNGGIAILPVIGLIVGLTSLAIGATNLGLNLKKGK